MAKKNEKNENFIQFYNDYMDAITNLAMTNKQAFRLFMFLVSHMDNANALCASYNVLTTILQISQSTLKRSISYLYNHGWIDILKSGGTNVYIINPEIAWKSYNNRKKYCKFNANIIVSQEENPQHEKDILDTSYLNNYDASNRFKHIDENFIKNVQKNREETEEILRKLEAGEFTDEEIEEMYRKGDIEDLPLEPTELC